MRRLATALAVLAALAHPVHHHHHAAPLYVSAAWRCIEWHESSDQDVTNAEGASGYFQIMPEVWLEFAHTPPPAADYSFATQLRVAEAIQRAVGWGAWDTAGMCGL